MASGTPPAGPLRAVVAIPVRNEAATIGACLSAIFDQADLAGRLLLSSGEQEPVHA